MAQGFMGALVIVMAKPLLATPLLGDQSARRIPGHFGFVNPMKLFMRPILAGPSRSDKLHLNSQLNPPGTQTRQTRGAYASKGRAIVATDPLRKTVNAKNTDELPLGLPQGLSS